MAQEIKSDVQLWAEKSEANKKALDLIDPEKSDFAYRYGTFKNMSDFYKTRERFEAMHKTLPQHGPTILPLLNELDQYWQCGTSNTQA